MTSFSKWWLLLGGVLAACDGTGSDIGPALPRISGASSKVVVLDDEGRGIVGATVQLVGTSARALTGRNGRGDLMADPRGSLLLQIDGAAAAAVDGDRLGSLRVATSSPGGDLRWPFHLPAVQGSVGGPLSVGMQTATTVIDDDATSGARVTIWNGSSLGAPNGASFVTVRTGPLRAGHLPGNLPTSGPQAVLLGRGIYLDPPDFSCAPGLTLDVVDDLALGSGTALLYHLDPDLGTWSYVDTGITSSGGRLVSDGAVVRGGLYAFGTAVVAGSVQGRVVDASTPPRPLPDVAVNVDGRCTTTAGDGTFTVDGVPAALGNGLGRSATVELFAGGSWLPARATTTVGMLLGSIVDIGTMTLDTMPAGTVRVQVVKRGRAEPYRRVAMSGLFGGVAQVTAGDAQGQVAFEDVPADWFGWQEGHPLDRNDNYYAQAVAFLDSGRRWLDAYQYYDELGWFIGSRRTRAFLTDAVGGGPLYDAVLVSGSSDGQGFQGESRESGILFVDRPMDGRATATFRSARDGRTIVHAFSIDTPNGEHIELPLQQVLRAPLGAFDRHGILEGVLTGADPTREHRLRATRRFELQEWWEDLVEGRPLPSSLPIDVDPAVTHGAFRAGVAVAGSHLAAAELSTTGGMTTLHKLGIVQNVMPSEGAIMARDVPLDLSATTPFVVPGALSGLDPAIAVGDLTFALALSAPVGGGVDVVRGIGGNHTASGDDLQVLLPALTGPLAGQTWCALLQGSAAAGGVTTTQRSLLRLTGSGAEASVPMLPPPVLTSPSAGATVPAAGFTVQYTLPPGSLYATIELRSDTGTELHLWQVTLPPGVAEFAFRVLPTEADTPLVAGKTYTLTLSAYRTLAGPLTDKPEAYRELTSFLSTIGALERGVDGMSSVAIQVTTN